ncbi:MAG: type II toxin-antitoxin system HicA family toxin [Cyanobacteriota bacterium]
MPKLPRLPADVVIAAPQRLGFRVVRQKGSHVVRSRTLQQTTEDLIGVTCVVPLHRRDLAVGTLASVLKQARVDIETFLDAL